MRYDEKEFLDLVAAELVLGTLSERAARRLLALAATRDGARAVHELWRRRIGRLLEGTKARKPTASLRAALLARVRERQRG